MVAEVLSPSRARNDRGDKRLACESLPTPKEYVLVWQDRQRVERRRGEAETRVFESPDDVLRLDSIGFEPIPGDLYA